MAQKVSILIVEDEPAIRSGLKDFLEFHHYDVVAAVDGLEAIQSLAEKRFDLILLDLMLPRISGEELCNQWRQNGLVTPIIMLTAKGREKERVTGLNLGADDYVTKPFSLEELHARIQAVLRRTDPRRKVGRVFRFGGWQVDMAALRIKNDLAELDISPREAQMIQCFAAQPGRVISREEMYRTVWQDDMSGIETRTVDMHIAKLRGKIEFDATNPQIIKTIRRAGYMYELREPNTAIET